MFSVLYIDDDSALLEIGKIYLERLGKFTVDIVSSAIEALDLILSKTYDAIISDYEMPQMDGIDLLKRVRNSGNTIPFILFTGRGREEIVIQALNEGADFYIQKGGDPKPQFTELSHKVSQAIQRKHAELALAESEERYRAVVEDQTELICRFTPDGRLTFVNDAYCRYFNLDKNQCLLQPPPIKIPPSDAIRLKEHLLSLSQDSPVALIEHRIIMPDGTIRWQRWNDRAIFGKDDHIIEYQSVGRDITEHKNVEQAFLKEKTFSDAVVDSIHGILFLCDSDGRLVRWNKSLERLTGYSDKELSGFFILEWFPDEMDRNIVKQGFERILKEGYASAEVNLETKDGKKIPFFFTGRLLEIEGKFYCTTVGNDITELQKTKNELQAAYQQLAASNEELLNQFNELALSEEALRESEDRNKIFIASVDEAIILQARNGEILTWNRAAEEMFGVDAITMLGHGGLDGKYHAIREDGSEFPDSEHPSLQTLATGIGCKNIIMGITSDSGRFFWVKINTNPLFKENDPVPYAVVISFQDITQRKQTEKALQESKNLFYSVTDNLLDPVIIVSSEGIVQFINQAAMQLLELPNIESIHRQSFLTYLDDDSGNRAIEDLRAVHHRGKPLTTKYYISYVNGEKRGIEACVIGINYKGSQAALVTLRDISKQIYFEEQLRGSEHKFTDIINFLPDATLVIDKNGVVLAWNIAMEKMTGFPAERMIGKGDYEYALPFYHERRPIMADLVLNEDPKIVKKYPVIKKEGNSFFSEIYIPHLNNGHGAHLWFTASALYDTAGNLIGAIESIRDITERIQIQDSLRLSEERYRNIVEDQTELISRFTPDGRLTFANDAYCQYFNLDKSQCIGNPHIVVLPPEDSLLMKKHLISLTPDNPVSSIDHRIIMHSGEVRWQRWNDHAFFDPENNVIEYQSVGRDITEQKILQMEMNYHEQELINYSVSLNTANKKISLLDSITRHDISNQLQVINGFLEILQMEVENTTLLPYFNRIMDASNRITAMIQFTKEYEQIGVNEPIWQNCSDLVKAAVKEAPLGKIEVINDLPNNTEIFADLLIVKVFYNLIDNAVRYGGKITNIRFSMEEDNNGLTIICEDNGCGIPVKEKKRIFDRGFGKNTGLGLALVHEILSITNITIHENGEPGVGARFEIFVPREGYRIMNLSHGQD